MFSVRKFLQLFIIIFFLAPVCDAQENIGIKFFGLSIHPKGEKENAFLMPNKLDPSAYFVMNFGAEFMYEKYIFKDLISVKIIQAFYADCAERLGGFSHVGLRAKIFKRGKHGLYGGLGPTLVFRRNWLQLEGYQNQNRFKGSVDDKYQHLFIWYGGEFEYKYELGQALNFTVSFVPGYPDLMSLSFGLDYRFDE